MKRERRDKKNIKKRDLLDKPKVVMKSMSRKVFRLLSSRRREPVKLKIKKQLVQHRPNQKPRNNQDINKEVLHKEEVNLNMSKRVSKFINLNKNPKNKLKRMNISSLNLIM
jgi:hypothetical protein